MNSLALCKRPSPLFTLFSDDLLDLYQGYRQDYKCSGAILFLCQIRSYQQPHQGYQTQCFCFSEL